jgi:gas vesicle protein
MDELNRRAFELDSRGGGGSSVMLFIAGAVVGAAAALILAPATGRDTRAFINRRGRELADEAARRGRELADEAATKGKKLWDEHGDRITSAVRKGYDQAKGTASEAVNGAADTGQPM